MCKKLIVMLIIAFGLSWIGATAVQAELILHLGGSATGYDSNDAAFFDKAKGNHALPTDAESGETGIGIVTGLEQTVESIIGNSAIGWRKRNPDKALNIDANNPDFDRSYDAFSVSLWYKPNQAYYPAENTNWLMGKMGNSGDRGWQLGANSSPYGDPLPIIFLYFDGPDGNNHKLEANGPSISQFPEFTHIAATFDSQGAAALYLDGLKVDESSALQNLNGQNNIPLQIGNRGGNASDSADGVIDDAAIWDETLSERRIAAIYAMGYFEGLDLQGESIDNLLNAFDQQGSTAVPCNVWEYTTGLEGEIGATGGTIADCNAFVVLDESGNGMALSSCGDVPSGDLNEDCVVDFKDFAVMAGRWLEGILPEE